jgi:hypothetical protein
MAVARLEPPECAQRQVPHIQLSGGTCDSACDALRILSHDTVGRIRDVGCALEQLDARGCWHSIEWNSRCHGERPFIRRVLKDTFDHRQGPIRPAETCVCAGDGSCLTPLQRFPGKDPLFQRRQDAA